MASTSTNSTNSNTASVGTPPRCIADFCLVPLGTPTASVSGEIAQVQRFLRTTGVKYAMHSAGTTLEGSWDECMRVIGQCHQLLHERGGIARIQTDIRVGSRTDKAQSIEDKVAVVERKLRESEG